MLEGCGPRCPHDPRFKAVDEQNRVHAHQDHAKPSGADLGGAASVSEGTEAPTRIGRVCSAASPGMGERRASPHHQRILRGLWDHAHQVSRLEGDLHHEPSGPRRVIGAGDGDSRP